MLKRYIITFVICIIGLLIGYSMIPRGSEVALMHARDKDYDIALQNYEQQKASGDLSVATVGALARLYLQYGDIDKAIVILEEFVRDHPKDVEARERLGQYYQYAQRTDDYLHNLEELAKIAPTPENLKKLSDVYNYNAQYDKQIAMLDTLTKNMPKSDETPADLSDLAELQAATGKKSEAVETLRRFETLYPTQMELKHKMLMLGLLVDTGKTDEAVERAKKWSAESKNPDDIASYINTIAAQGSLPSALAVASDYSEKVESAPTEYASVLEVLTSLESQSGYEDRAFARLKRLYDRKTLPESLNAEFMELALSRQEYTLAEELVKTIDVKNIPLPTQTEMAALAVDDRYKMFSDVLEKNLSKEYIESHSVLQTALVMSHHDKTATLRQISHLDFKGMKNAEIVRLSTLFADNGYDNEAFEALKHVNTDDLATDPLLITIATNYGKINRTREGLTFFEALKGKRDSEQVRYGWVLLNAAAGEDAIVRNWMDAPENQNNNRLLLDLYYISSEHNRDALSLQIAQRLFKNEDNKTNRLNLANAWLENKDPKQALALLEPLLAEDGSDVDQLYYNALTDVIVKNKVKGAEYAQLRQKLLTHLTAEMRNPATSAKRRNDILYAILDLKGYDIALPELRKNAEADPVKWGGMYIEYTLKHGKQADAIAYINAALKRKLPEKIETQFIYTLVDQGEPSLALPYLRGHALSKGGSWMFAYDEALAKSGRSKEAYSFWKEMAAKPNLSADDKRVVAYKLVDANDLQGAGKIFFELAQNKPANSDDVKELIYVWDANPPLPVMDWFEKRAFAAKGNERAAWLAHLNTMSGYYRVVRVVDSNKNATLSGPVLEEYMVALGQLGDRQRLRELLDTELAKKNDRDRLTRLAEYARDAGLNGHAIRAYEKVLTFKAYKPEVLRELGTLHYFEGNGQASERYYHDYLKALNTNKIALDEKKDFDVFLRMGLVEKEKGNPQTASKLFVSALEMINRQKKPTREARLSKAKALFHLNEQDQAWNEYAALRKEFPKDLEIVADHVEAKILAKQYAEATRILDETLAAEKPKELIAGKDGAKASYSAYDINHMRLEMQRAQVDYETGDMKQAATRYKQIAATYPESGYPLIALADIDNNSGNWKSALSKLHTAEELTPFNRDISRIRRDIMKEHASNVKVDYEWRDMERAERGSIVTISGHTLLDDYSKLGVIYALNQMKVDSFVMPNGTTGNFRGSGYSAELFYEWFNKMNHLVHAGLLHGESGLGATVRYSVPDYGKVTRFLMEYHRPYWDIAEGVPSEAAVDRLGVGHSREFNKHWYANLDIALNNYSIHGDNSVAKSTTAEGNLGYRLRLFDPIVTLLYTLDAEYLFSEADEKTGPNGTYRPFPLRTREVHSLGLNLTDSFNSGRGLWEMFAGYSMDRLEGHGPFMGGLVEYEITDHLLSQLRASYSYNSSGVGGDAKRVGGYLQWRF